ncbi:hypothetical protein BCV70DRAFT_224488 [Testicularia cyperi]|uniref:Zn(2)-C6 fungal-type domain-containing protein n=1 Tax=Testicularia cyperi TaxID=1882483 RepID=A0A317XXK6_9BASI|nr:hypothetical protein BCV70DRAFT_224488 [Testicularia cyperi]
MPADAATAFAPHATGPVNSVYTDTPRGYNDFMPGVQSIPFAPRPPAWEPQSHPSDVYAQRHTGYQHQRPVHHPYAAHEARHMGEVDPLYVPNAHHQHGPSHHPAFVGSHLAGMHASSSRQPDLHHRHVSRAACLSCRSAKRKCDGVKPVCGPCTLRGVKEGVSQDDGGCVFVASKRGGPRFKGVKGAEATRKKLDERDRLGKARTGRMSDGYGPDDGQSMSPPDHSSSHFASPHQQQAASASSASASDLPSLQSQSTDVNYSLSPTKTPDMSFSPSGSGTGSATMAGRGGFFGEQAPGASVPSHHETRDAFTFDREREALNSRTFLKSDAGAGGGLFDDLCNTNLELLQKLQNAQTSVGLSLASFYQKIEDLPKAGILSMSSVDEFGSVDVDMPQALLEIETANLSSAAVNSEQQSRALLSDFYELVYPACPVMLPSGHLSSLAFHLSEDESSALLAAISACVALQMPQAEVRRIVKGSLLFQDPDDHETKAELLDLEHASREDIAAYHAKSAEKLLLKKVALLARASSFGTDATKAADLPRLAAGSDLELVRIKLVATHTLLAHYHYGMSNSRRAFHHAMQAWNHAQALNLDAGENGASAPSWFSHEQKCEWARRAYWTCYTAATVMSCTGGFKPLTVTRDMPSDLGLLPNLKGDRSSWKVLVRGTQFVSRAYSSLYDLDTYKNRPDNKVLDPATQTREKRRKWESIFERMQKVDADVMQYTRNDAVWSDEACFAPSVGLSRRIALFEEENETRLSRSLRIAGKLMTSGALIILHRAQAFANAKIFVAPTCGIPGACEEGNSDTASDAGNRSKAGLDHLWHRDLDEQPTFGKGPAGEELLSPTLESASVGNGGSAADRSVRSRSASSLSSSGAGSLAKSIVSSSSSSNAATRGVVFSASGIPLRFDGGPFEPSDSLDRCRFAASVMYAQLDHINTSTFQHGRRESMAVLPVETAAMGGIGHAQSREMWSAPSLPPFSACSLVLAAYVLLMETLHAQIAASAHDSATSGDQTMEEDEEVDEDELDQELPPVLRPDPFRSTPIPQPKGRQARRLALKLRDCVVEIECALEKFARAWDVAKGYSQEVTLLLEVNQSLFTEA